jgi:hypothetical protein
VVGITVGACGGDDDAAIGFDAAVAPDAAPACPGGQLEFAMFMHDAGNSFVTLPGVHACVFEHDEIPCADGDEAFGRWAICVDPDTDVAFTLEKDGYVPTIYPVHTPAALPLPPHMAQGVMFTPDDARGFWDSASIEFPPTTEGIALVRTHTNAPDQSLEPPLLGEVSATFTPAAAQGPYYAGADGMYDATATADTEPYPQIYGAGLAVGHDQIVTLSHPTLTTCAQLDGGWAGANANEIRIPVRAGFRTSVMAECH